MTAPSHRATEAPPDAARVSLWAVLRATLASALILLWVLSALPSQPLDAERLARPAAARAVQSVQQALSALGIEVSRADVEATAIALTGPVVAARNALVDPLTPALELAQMGQRWGLFLQTGRTAYRIELAGRRQGEPFEVLYRPHEVDALGRGSTLAFRRLRGLYNPGAKGAPRAQFEGFVDWVARVTFAARPELVALRVRMERLRLGNLDTPTEVVEIAHESLRARRGEPP